MVQHDRLGRRSHVQQAVKRDPDHADDIGRGKPSIEQIDASKRATPPAFYSTLLADLAAFETTIRARTGTGSSRCGLCAKFPSGERRFYESVYRLAERFARELESRPAQAQQTPGSGSSASTSANTRTNTNAPSPLSRPHCNARNLCRRPLRPTQSQESRAARKLIAAGCARCAHFFRGYGAAQSGCVLAEKAAEAADMPLHQWLSTVVKDDGSLAHIPRVARCEA